MREFLKTNRVLKSYVIATAFLQVSSNRKLANLSARAHPAVYQRELFDLIQISDQ